MQEKLEILNTILGSYHSSNSEYLFHCPYCNHHKRKLSINLTSNVYKCWICDARGRNIYRLIRRFGNFNQRQQWKELTGQVNISEFDNFLNLFDEKQEEEYEEIMKLPEDFISLTGKSVPKSAIPALKYLHARDITRNDILKWKIGYCTLGPYSGRIIIPSFNLDGRVNYFIARTYNENWRRYLNPSKSNDIVFNELYVDWDNDLILVEGAFDAIVAGNAVPILGSTLREKSRLLQEIVKHDTPVFVALDEDAREKENKILSLLLKYGIETYKIDTGGYEDVGAMPREVFKNRKENSTAVGLGDYILTSALNAI